ncbi:hypothetical protein BDK51DRAFT_50246 [Blyttiomyces helicus]|uniref:Uncharacterized protein n=1 Tax=Blyttiomyces helicus TaxID=388810 RepID=A0A4P9VT83_9FUNG|nr:hypothetical protein BDK51DRAFT_50246 [Blyttiomyces helicus]|eukprot:RKO82709.1 hypothetical protein BDK51DRAFT_50246 [Blyttiomyces helicus]
MSGPTENASQYTEEYDDEWQWSIWDEGQATWGGRMPTIPALQYHRQRLSRHSQRRPQQRQPIPVECDPWSHRVHPPQRHQLPPRRTGFHQHHQRRVRLDHDHGPPQQAPLRPAQTAARACWLEPLHGPGHRRTCHRSGQGALAERLAGPEDYCVIKMG